MKIETILSDIIRIESVNPPGGEIGVATYLKKLFDQQKIPSEIIESSPGRASFIATLGEGKRSLLYLSHADVVPVSDGWSFPPFSGEIKDGFVHGRGALDCKGLVAAEAFAMLTLAQTTRLKGRLIFAATADEETGGKMGAQYLAEHFPEKIRADFAVNEGAEAPVGINGKPCHFISVGEKGPSWLKLKTKGVAGHGSVPYLPNNAVVKMAKVLNSLANYTPRVVLTPEVKHLIQSIAELNGFPKEVNEGNLNELFSHLKDVSLSAYLRAITRMTISPNVIQGGVKTNIVPDSCQAEVDIRILPGQNKKYVLNELKPILGDTEIETIQYHAPTLSSTDTDAYRLITDTLKECLGEVTVMPTICAGATDSRYMREMGVPSYGIGMMTFKIDPAMKASVHGKDEKLDIESLRLKSDFLVRLAKKYLGV
ncbi:MAG: M20/M25/M40 family metallo-hydrolase [Dehalococcoidales bacterium]|nr:M20/M25/M40 family metallo-hydrolase [Dehalococcoidales bacterium]